MRIITHVTRPHIYALMHTFTNATQLLCSNLCNACIIISVYFLEMRHICQKIGSLKLYKQLLSRGAVEELLSFHFPCHKRELDTGLHSSGACKGVKGLNSHGCLCID